MSKNINFYELFYIILSYIKKIETRLRFNKYFKSILKSEVIQSLFLHDLVTSCLSVVLSRLNKSVLLLC